MGHTNFSTVRDFYSTLNSMYLPLITEYTDYDFKNWQTLESVEDSAWETSYVSNSHNDYIDITNIVKLKNTFSAQDVFYNSLNRNFKFNNNKQYKSDLTSISLPILSDEFISPLSL
jgi:hypothetical protein